MRKTLFYYLAIAFSVCLTGGTVNAQVTEGKEFNRIETPVRVSVDPGKVEVREFFLYSCPHCYSVEAYIEKWKPAENVVFIRTPVMFSKRWEAHAHAYYALEQLDQLDKAHPLLFEALHQRKMKLNTAESLAEFFEEEIGLDKRSFLQTYHSFAVATKIKQAERLTKQYAIKGVPAFVVQGKYLTAPSLRPVGYKRLTEVLDHLVRRETKSSS